MIGSVLPHARTKDSDPRTQKFNFQQYLGHAVWGPALEFGAGRGFSANFQADCPALTSRPVLADRGFAETPPKPPPSVGLPPPSAVA